MDVYLLANYSSFQPPPTPPTPFISSSMYERPHSNYRRCTSIPIYTLYREISSYAVLPWISIGRVCGPDGLGSRQSLKPLRNCRKSSTSRASTHSTPHTNLSTSRVPSALRILLSESSHSEYRPTLWYVPSLLGQGTSPRGKEVCGAKRLPFERRFWKETISMRVTTSTPCIRLPPSL